MSHYIAFLKKELIESMRTYKLLIMLLVFFALGILNPLSAKLIPDLVHAFLPDGMSVAFAAPTAFDAWTQFFKNTSQMGLIVMVILFSGVLGAEISKGTLTNLLTKGLSRRAVLLAKYTSMALIWTMSIGLSFFVTWGYTVYLFPDGEAAHLFFSVFCMWLFGMFLLALLLCAATLTKNSYGCLLITGTGIVACMLCNIIPAAQKYNPLSLASRNMDLLTNAMVASSLYSAMGVSGMLSLILIALSVLLFGKKQL